MVDHDDDDELIDEGETPNEQCPNCGHPISWEDVCADCGFVFDEEEEEQGTVLEEDLDVDNEDESDYDLEELEREGYGIEEFDELDDIDEDDPFTEDEDEI